MMAQTVYTSAIWGGVIFDPPKTNEYIKLGGLKKWTGGLNPPSPPAIPTLPVSIIYVDRSQRANHYTTPVTQL